MAKRKITVTFSVDPDLVKKVDRVAKSFGLNRSVWIEKTLRNAVSGDEMGVKMLTHPGFAEAFVQILTDPNVLRGLASAMGEEISDEQMRLFGESLKQVTKKGSLGGR